VIGAKRRDSNPHGAKLQGIGQGSVKESPVLIPRVYQFRHARIPCDMGGKWPDFKLRVAGTYLFPPRKGSA